MGTPLIGKPCSWQRLRWMAYEFRFLFLLAAIPVLLLLAGCEHLKGGLNDPRSVWCDQNSPRRDATAATPRWELDEINAHNAKGVAWCGWKA